MAAPLTLEPVSEEVQYQTTAQRYLEEMARLREEMQISRREMEQNRSEPGALMAQINALFSKNKG